MAALPRTQSELIRTARALRSQAEFARILGVDRSCLSRYESEVLGAPPSVINYCLSEIARLLEAQQDQPASLGEALKQAREVVEMLERACEYDSRMATNTPKDSIRIP